MARTGTESSPEKGPSAEFWHELTSVKKLEVGLVSRGGESLELVGGDSSKVGSSMATSSLEKSKRSSTMKWSEAAVFTLFVVELLSDCGQKLVWKNS